MLISCSSPGRLAFQTAVALAEFEANRGPDGRILIDESHILQVAETSRDFKLYLEDLHDGNESVRALRAGNRADRFVSRAKDEREFECVEPAEVVEI